MWNVAEFDPVSVRRKENTETADIRSPSSNPDTIGPERLFVITINK